MYLSEMTDVTGMASRSIEVELKNLRALGLLTSAADRSRIYYSANKNHPIYQDLRSIVQKTAGPLGLLQEALAINGVDYAFLSECPPDADRIPENAHLYVILKENANDINSLTDLATMAAGRQLQMEILPMKSLREHWSAGTPSITNVLRNPKTFVIGREDRLFTDLGNAEIDPDLSIKETVP
jgi:hypothetical protein